MAFHSRHFVLESPDHPARRAARPGHHHLQHRARDMAQTDILLESGTNELEIVEFYIEEMLPDGERYRGYYGINVAKVLEIIRCPKVTEMPNLNKPSIMGTFNLRNRVIPLVDLAGSLGKTQADTGEPKAVVTEFNGVINAFKVSGVTRIHRLGWDRIEPPGRHMLHMTGESITGVVKIDDRVVFILDMEKIIGDLAPRFALREIEDGEARADFVYKTLISDDSGTIRRMIQSSLTKMGFEVTATRNGQDAWENLLKFKEKAQQAGVPLSEMLHVIISDIEMPVMDGHSLTRRIKEDPYFKELPVILFSSLITDSLRHKGEAVGADEQISKPDMKFLADRAGALADRYLGRA